MKRKRITTTIGREAHSKLKKAAQAEGRVLYAFLDEVILRGLERRNQNDTQKNAS